MRTHRPEGAMLAGVCAGIARSLSWNVWVLRALFVGFLALKTIPALIVYAVLAVFFNCSRDTFRRGGSDESLQSPELSDRNERIRDLEQRFRDLERSERNSS